MEDFSLAQRKACSQETDSCLLWVPGAEKGRKILGVFVVSLLARGFYLLQKHTHQSQDTKKNTYICILFHRGNRVSEILHQTFKNSYGSSLRQKRFLKALLA